jgi:hypothetical protein
MKTTVFSLAVLLALAAGAQAQSQDASTQEALPKGAPAQDAQPQNIPSPADLACPQLPADSGLVWMHRATPTSDFCRAVRLDGSEAFGLFIANDSPFEPKRKNRAEQATIDGRDVQWYRSELAAQPDVRARETLIELPGGRVAHLWIQAKSDRELAEAMWQTTTLRFRRTQLSSN